MSVVEREPKVLKVNPVKMVSLQKENLVILARREQEAQTWTEFHCLDHLAKKEDVENVGLM